MSDADEFEGVELFEVFASRTQTKNPYFVFDSPQTLLECAQEYFKWTKANPYKESQAFAYQGELTIEKLPKMRVVTHDGLCLYLGITRGNYDRYRNDPQFAAVTELIDQAIREQKFTAAAAGLLNGNLIARDLGLGDKVSNELTGKDGGPIETRNANVSVEAKDAVEAARIYRDLMTGDDND